MKIRKSLAKGIFIILFTLIINCVSEEQINRIILLQSIETRVGKHTGNVNLGFHISPIFMMQNYVINPEKNVIIEPLGLNANFVYIKPNIPISILISQGLENYFAEIHLYLPQKPFSLGIGISRLWATHFKSTNFCLLLNFISNNYNIYGSVGYLRTPVYRGESHTIGSVQSSSLGINKKINKNIGLFITFSNFYILKGIKSYDEVKDEFRDVKYNIVTTIFGYYLEF